MTKEGNFRTDSCCFKRGNPAQHMLFIWCQIISFVKTRIFQIFPHGDRIAAGQGCESRTTTSHWHFYWNKLRQNTAWKASLHVFYPLWVVNFNHRIKNMSIHMVNSPDSEPYTSSHCVVQPPGHRCPQSHDLWRAEWDGPERQTHLFFLHPRWETERITHTLECLVI